MTTPTPLPFLSPEWFDAVHELHDQHLAEALVGAAADGRPLPSVGINFTVSAVPFGDGTVAVSLDTSSGIPVVELGLLETAEVSVSAEYDTAKAVLVGGDPGAAMAAFLRGEALVQGDLMSLIALNMSLAADARALEFAAAVRDVTA